jgi:hypothetical protein
LSSSWLVALVLHYVSLDNYLVHLYNTALILAALKHARESESPREAEARKSAFDLDKSNYDHHLGKWSHNINRAVDAKRKELASVPTVGDVDITLLKLVELKSFIALLLGKIALRWKVTSY